MFALQAHSHAVGVENQSPVWQVIKLDEAGMLHRVQDRPASSGV